MQRVLIYDPLRTPRHWVELLRPGQFAVFLHDVETSVVVDLDGLPSIKTSSEACYIFDSLNDAREFCEGITEKVENIRCEIYDERGKAVAPLYTIVNKRHRHHVMSRNEARLLILGAALVPFLSLPLFWYDWLSGGARIWPTIIGINVVVLGLRLLYWGYSELEQLRRHEAEQALAETRSRT